MDTRTDTNSYCLQLRILELILTFSNNKYLLTRIVLNNELLELKPEPKYFWQLN